MTKPLPTQPMPGRRDFLRAAAAALTAGAVTRATGQETEKRPVGSVPVIDTHLHCFDGPDSDAFPYHARGPYRPADRATPEHLLRCMEGAGVDHAVVVHPEPYQDDHRYLEHCLQVGQGRLKGTCLFFADRPDSLRRMAPFLAAHAGSIVASRMHAYAPDRLPPFGHPEMRSWWRTVAESGAAVQIHLEPRYAPGFEPYLREFASTTVIIDHLGRPFQGTPQEHATVLRWSELPNTIMKLASIPSPQSYPHRDIRPVIRRLTDAWGAERMIYGGGFNAQATPQSYRAYRDQLAGYLDHLSESERKAILGGTAAKLFGWS